ncbi:MAG: ABC transporter ATP-binding protein [Desulfobacterales bacterium]|nr:ABC transporter ATP-binding protein [Desulfobacterales bacterium]
MIELQNTTKHYGKTLAVNTLSLTVPAGQIFGFIGPNGAGKTTTIKMMGGLLAPTSGSVNICGTNMATHPEQAKTKIGFIPDRPYLYEKITAMEFLRFTAALYGVDGSGFVDRAQEKLHLFSLLDWANELIGSFSHGMKQRLIMAAALLHNPEVIIVDEPMVGLDPVAIKMVKSLFKRLAAEGAAIFMSTHTLQVAEDVCDRIGVIHKGALLAIGTTDELRQNTHLQGAALEDVFIKLTTEN